MAELHTILDAISSIKTEIATLSTNFRSVEKRVSRLEEAAHTPPASPGYSLDGSDGGVALPALEASKSLVQIKSETPDKDASPTVNHRQVPTNARRLDIDSPFRAADLQHHLQPLATGIENLTRCILGIEKALARLSPVPDKPPAGPFPCGSRENASCHFSDSSRKASSSTIVNTTRPSSGASSTLTANSTGLTNHTEPFPPLEDATNTVNSGATSPSSTDIRFSECPQGTPTSFRGGKQRNITNTGLPDHSLPIFGQPSTPSLPKKHRVTINVDASPYGKYDDERSPFSQLTKGSARVKNRFSAESILPFYLEARVADVEDAGTGSSPLRSRTPKVLKIMPTVTMRG